MAYMGVEALCEECLTHHQVLSECGAADLDMQDAIAHIELSGVGRCDGAGHFLPRLDDAVLQERGLQSLIAQVFLHELADGLDFVAFHALTSPPLT